MLLLLVLTGLNFIYTFTLYPYDIAERCEQLLQIKDQESKSDLFYFGESSNFNARETDSIKNSISEITNFFYPSLKITAINKPATHGGIFKEWLKQIDLNKSTLKALVITLNLRSFDAAWIHSRLETPLRESMVLMRPYPNMMNRFMLSLQAFDNKSEQQREKDMLYAWRHTPLLFPFPFKYKTVSEWDSAMAAGSYLKPDGSWDTEKIVLACHYVKAYAFNLDESNPRVKDFDEITAWCSEKKMPLYLNLLAENIEYADSLVGKELVFLMRQNRDFLVERYNKGSCHVVDNLEAVKGLEFTDQTWTTEHYGYRGRMIVARNLANALKAQFNNEYKKAY